MRGDGKRPSGTVTFLFTDVEGSTALWERHGHRMGEQLARHEAILRGAIEAHDGHIFSLAGDAFAVAFQTPQAAAAAAASAQDELRRQDWPDGLTIRVRMGMHTGTAEERAGNYFGPTVNRAARIMSAGHGNQVLVSDVTAHLLEDMELVDLGQLRLKDFTAPEQVWQVGSEDFALVRSFSGRTGNLPAPVSSFVGRRTELGDLAELATTQRLITLVGPGGLGKTRLAIEFADRQRHRFPDGVWFVDLATVEGGDAVAHTLAAALGVSPQQGMDATGAVVEYLRGRQVMVVVDGCEHVIEDAARLVSALAVGARTVSLLATSREPLAIEGEHVWPVPALDASVELFLARAAGSGAGAQDAELVAELCHRLEHMPLAIELAAARTRSMTVGSILNRLDDRLRLLRARGRVRPGRQQTMAATVQWSYDLLGNDERIVFDRLAAFAGSFDEPAAIAVCAGQQIDPFDVVEIVGVLVDKSMVMVDRGGRNVRFRLLETFRQFGDANLYIAGEREALQTLHLDHYAKVGDRVGTLLEGPDCLAAVEEIEAEWPNFRAAIDRALATGRTADAEAILRGLAVYAWFNVRDEIGEWARRVAAAPGASGVGAAVAALLVGLHGDQEAALVWCSRARAAGSDDHFVDAFIEGQARQNAYWFTGRTEESAAARADTHAVAERFDRAWAIAYASGLEVFRCLVTDEIEAADDWAMRCRSHSERAGDMISAAWVELACGSLAAARGRQESSTRLTEARELAAAAHAYLITSMVPMMRAGFLRTPDEDVVANYQQAIRETYEAGNYLNLDGVLGRCAAYLDESERRIDAAPLLGYLDAAGRLIGGSETKDAVARLRLDPTLALLLAQGAAMDREEAIDYALGLATEHPPPADTRPPSREDAGVPSPDDQRDARSSAGRGRTTGVGPGSSPPGHTVPHGDSFLEPEGGRSGFGSRSGESEQCPAAVPDRPVNAFEPGRSSGKAVEPTDALHRKPSDGAARRPSDTAGSSPG